LEKEPRNFQVSKMKAVLDTNIWLSGIFWEGEASRIMDLIEKKKIEALISEKIIEEIITILNSEAKFQKFIENRKESIEELTRTILSISTLVEIKTKLEVIKEHLQDNIILETAFDGKADYIVSYDKHILNMLEFREIKIIHPTEFLRIVK
jgi:putative PIN family toxin of toxin-antitoxin system